MILPHSLSLNEGIKWKLGDSAIICEGGPSTKTRHNKKLFRVMVRDRVGFRYDGSKPVKGVTNIPV